MNFIDQIFHNSEAIFDALNFIGILATVIVSVYIFKAETITTFAKERHEKLICPLFITMEPYLYSNQIPDILPTILNIIEENRVLADGKLLSIYYYCQINPNGNNYWDLCRYIDIAFDKSCKRMKLKLRPITYRINRKQYPNRFYLIWYFVLFALPMLLLFFALLAILLISCFMFAIEFNSVSLTTKIIYLLFASLCLVAICKYITNH